MKAAIIFFLCLSIPSFFFLIPDSANAGPEDALRSLVGKNDSVLVSDAKGRILFSKNEHVPRIPASTLKVFTALTAIHYLGPDYRFSTDFFMDSEKNLLVKGYGDPLLVSEVLDALSSDLSKKITRIRDIILDDSFFDTRRVPGAVHSFQPYDSPVGALCVNFNTVNFSKKNGKIISAEPQTPLVNFVLPRIRESGRSSGRILLSEKNDEYRLYSGHLIQAFLEIHGVKTSGSIRIGKKHSGNHFKKILHRQSPFTLTDVLSRMLTYSNNFVANQVFLTVGATMYGTPGTLEKGKTAAFRFAKSFEHSNGLRVHEGSGLSRQNRMTAVFMNELLGRFEPWKKLLNRSGRSFSKTGTLDGIRNEVGYIQIRPGEFYRYVIFVNSPKKTTRKIKNAIVSMVR